MATRTRTRPVRCRLGRHAWSLRTNPETGEHFEVCVRCDAYRDRSQGAPGAVWG